MEKYGVNFRETALQPRELINLEVSKGIQQMLNTNPCETLSTPPSRKKILYSKMLLLFTEYYQKYTYKKIFNTKMYVFFLVDIRWLFIKCVVGRGCN